MFKEMNSANSELHLKFRLQMQLYIVSAFCRCRNITGSKSSAAFPSA